MQDGEEEEAFFLQLIASKTPSALEYLPRQRSSNKSRDPEGHYERLLKQYFVRNPIYSDANFRRRFRMSKLLFDHIYTAVVDHDPYFHQRANAAGKLGLHPLLKVTAAMRMLAYGGSADALDENLGLSESTALESLRHFCSAVVSCFGETYLSEPTAHDMEQLFEANTKRGFSGMLGSLDCMHWTWDKCPTAQAGQYAGKAKKPTVVLEAWADHDLRIWHCNFGWPGSLNDINILHRSTLFDSFMEGKAPAVEYVINGNFQNNCGAFTETTRNNVQHGVPSH
jgi:hypothetical protein